MGAAEHQYPVPRQRLANVLCTGKRACVGHQEGVRELLTDAFMIGVDRTRSGRSA
ncbi:hypothetical protein [Streptomyces sp. NPDC002205]|uniref:hypothetical protein n=1 Tax=Streptomyces sp. NPDC002205 TaxID=3154411 RepID=UPI00332091AA